MFENDNTGVENNVAVDSVEVAAQQDSSEEQQIADSLEAFISEGEEETEAEDKPETESAVETTEEPAQQTEPVNKGIRGRIQAAEQKADARGYERGIAEAKTRWEAEKAEYEKQLEKYREMELNADAEALARKEHCSVDFAKRMLRLERNMGINTAAEEKPKVQERDESGRFKSPSNTVKERADFLYKQAQEVQKSTGIDVLDLFQNDQTIKDKIASGEWDFKDVAIKQLSNTTQKKPVPKPITSGGGKNTNAPLDFDNMTDEQFDKFNERIKRGAVYRVR